MIKADVLQTSGTLDTLIATSVVGGPTVPIGNDRRKLDRLAAKLIVLAETDTLTISAKWQGSNDAATWIDILHEPQNPAAVVLATGTAGADTAVTKVLPAPPAIYSCAFARVALIVGVATGAVGDTYTFSYFWRTLDT